MSLPVESFSPLDEEVLWTFTNEGQTALSTTTPSTDPRFVLDCPDEEVWIPSDQTIHWGKKPNYSYPSVQVMQKENVEVPRGSKLVAKLWYAAWHWDEETLILDDNGRQPHKADPAETPIFEDDKTIVPFEKCSAAFRHIRFTKAIKLKKTETCSITTLGFEVGYHDPFSKTPFKSLDIYLSKNVNIHVVAHKGSVRLMQKYGLLPNTVQNGLTIGNREEQRVREVVLDSTYGSTRLSPLILSTKRSYDAIEPVSLVDPELDSRKKSKVSQLSEIMEELSFMQERMNSLKQKINEFVSSGLPQQVDDKLIRLRCNPEEFGMVGGTSMFIFYAMRIRNLDLLQTMMQTFGIDIHVSDSCGHSLLHIAARTAFMDGVQWAIQNGATVNAISSFKSTPLHMAYLRDDKEIRHVLKGVKADMNAVNIFGCKPKDYHNQRRPLMKPRDIQHGCVEVVIDGFARPFILSVWFAARIGWMEVVKIYISKFGVDPDTKSTNGQTPLMCAAEYNHPHVVKYLLKIGADPNARDIHDKTPLHYAYMNYSMEIVELLEEQGADATLLNIWGKSPLWYKYNHQGRESGPTASPSLVTHSTFVQPVNSLFRSLA